MITAREAVALTEQSEEAMTRRLEQIGLKIRESCLVNKRELILDYALPYDPIYKCEEQRAYQSYEMTPIQRLLKEKLKPFGYDLAIKLINTKIGGGLCSMDDEVKYEDLPHLCIRW
jgi:hypothetical protein